MIFSRAWAMPSRHTFEIAPIASFVRRYMQNARISIDPFCGRNPKCTYNNDLAYGGINAPEFLRQLADSAVLADLIIFDPPYSPRQIKECYNTVGRQCSIVDTQNARLYGEVKAIVRKLLLPGAVVLSFGWNSSGMGKGFETMEILLVCHGSAHNDTICMAERMIAQQTEFAL